MSNVVTVADAVNEFLVAARADGKKTETIRWYRSRLKQMVSHLGARTLAALTVSDVREYLVELRGRKTRYHGATYRREVRGGLSKDTVHGHLRALRYFFAWAAAEYALVGWNPMGRVQMPRLDHSAVPKAASLDDLAQLLAVMGDDPAGRRDRAILLFLADTGCRAGGLLQLKLCDLNLHDGSAMVCEKGGRSRLVYFGAPVAVALARWFEVRPAGQFVFCSMRSGSEALTLGGLHCMIRRRKKKAGVSGRVNPHAWRHCFGKSYIDAGGDAGSLRRLMGHSDVKTTLTYYISHTDRELAQKHDQYSPLRLLEGVGR